MSRLEEMRERGGVPQFPEIPDELQYLVDYLFEAGPTMSGGMGPVPLSSAELRHWQDLAGFELQPWEARMLRRLSADYAAELHRAKRPSALPPYGTHSRILVASKLEAFAAQFARPVK